MGTDNITCPSKAPVAGCAVGVPASVRTRGFGPQLAAARLSCGLGFRSLGWLANAVGTAYDRLELLEPEARLPLKAKLKDEWLAELARRTGREVRIETDPGLAIEAAHAQLLDA